MQWGNNHTAAIENKAAGNRRKVYKGWTHNTDMSSVNSRHWSSRGQKEGCSRETLLKSTNHRTRRVVTITVVYSVIPSIRSTQARMCVRVCAHARHMRRAAMRKAGMVRRQVESHQVSGSMG